MIDEPVVMTTAPAVTFPATLVGAVSRTLSLPVELVKSVRYSLTASGRTPFGP